MRHDAAGSCLDDDFTTADATIRGVKSSCATAAAVRAVVSVVSHPVAGAAGAVPKRVLGHHCVSFNFLQANAPGSDHATQPSADALGLA